VLYELHIGTFTEEGTYSAAEQQLDELAELGITIIELMPLADFPGNFGWGYDGVNLFAPNRLYGTPDDLRRFVNAAHAKGIGVILDVVYNHLGPDGNYLPRFSGEYLTDRHRTDWGEAINFDGPDSGPVREFFLSNAAYWIDEFHMDGLRLDATQDIHDESPQHFLAALSQRTRAAAKGRAILLTAENEPQHTRLIRPVDEGGFGLDALWNDDFHHTAMVALSGRAEAYYSDYRGRPQEFISALKYGFLFQGQHYSWQGKRRGTLCFGIHPASFIGFLQNHDQIANSLRGARCQVTSHPACLRALTALWLLAPHTPLLFHGQEFGSTSPFYFFADHQPELAEKVRNGRREFLTQFSSVVGCNFPLPDPADPSTFQSCKLRFAERDDHADTYSLFRDLLRLRREDVTLREAQRTGGLDGAVLGEQAFVLRFFSQPESTSQDRLLVLNLGCDLHLIPAPEPLLAPPEDVSWTLQWSSEDPKYGGSGIPRIEFDENWIIPGRAALLLQPMN
jgi:maltooligosyltrehalose trehalohydrolase